LQSENADKQFRNNIKLTYLALVFAFISIVPILIEYIPIFETKNNDRDIYELKTKYYPIKHQPENQVSIESGKRTTESQRLTKSKIHNKKLFKIVSDLNGAEA
jgi:hypothetical protein